MAHWQYVASRPRTTVYRDGKLMFTGASSECAAYIRVHGEDEDVVSFPAYVTTVAEERQIYMADAAACGMAVDKKTRQVM